MVGFCFDWNLCEKSALMRCDWLTAYSTDLKRTIQRFLTYVFIHETNTPVKMAGTASSRNTLLLFQLATPLQGTHANFAHSDTEFLFRCIFSFIYLPGEMSV